jgi:hypothetical protein
VPPTDLPRAPLPLPIVSMDVMADDRAGPVDARSQTPSQNSRLSSGNAADQLQAPCSGAADVASRSEDTPAKL